MSVKVVRAGALSDAKSLIQTLINGIDKMFSAACKERNWKMSEGEDNSDGSTTYTISERRGKIRVKISPMDESGNKFKIEAKGNNGRTYNAKNMTKKDLDKALNNMCDKIFGKSKTGGDNTVEDMNASSSTNLGGSSTIKAKLRKVTSAKETQVDLVAIQCSTPADALSVIELVVGDDDFVNSLPEGESSYCITDDGSDYDVNYMAEDDNIDVDECYQSMLNAALILESEVRYLKWNVQGEDSEYLRNVICNQTWGITSQIDTLADICMEKLHSVEHPMCAYSKQCEQLPCVDQTNDAECTVAALKKSYDEYTAVLECYYCNLPHDIQNVVDGWIRENRQFSDLTLSRIRDNNSDDCDDNDICLNTCD